MCCVIYLDFPLNNHMAKTDKKRGHNFFIHTHMGNNCTIVSWLGFIQIWSQPYEQESTNYSDHFVDWKSRYITMESDLMLFANLFELTWMICVGGSCPRPYASAASLPWDLTYMQVRLLQIWTNRIFNSIQSLFFIGSLIQDKACFLLVV